MGQLVINYLSFARAVDFGLLILFGVTLALTLVKTIDLFFPKLYGRISDIQALSSDLNAPSMPSKLDCQLRLEAAIERLEKGIPFLATIASSAPFLGLAGTVLHIMDALSKISGAALDISIISGPISTALLSTLLGMVSAVLANVAYNTFIRKMQVTESRIERDIARRCEQ